MSFCIFMTPEPDLILTRLKKIAGFVILIVAVKPSSEANGFLSVSLTDRKPLASDDAAKHTLSDTSLLNYTCLT